MFCAYLLKWDWVYWPNGSELRIGLDLNSRKGICVRNWKLLLAYIWILCNYPTGIFHFTCNLPKICSRSAETCRQRSMTTHNPINICICTLDVEVKQSMKRSRQILRVSGGWASQISRHSVHKGGKVVSPMQLLPLRLTRCSWCSFLLEAESTPGP
jgi:hypothetical protein